MTTREDNSLASPAFWDEVWRVDRAVRVVPERDVHFGRRGTFLRVVDRYLDATGLTVLEVGGAASYRLLALAKFRGVRATALDYSRAGLELTKELFRANGCDLETIEHDFLDWEPAGRTFDLVVHWGVAEHFKDPAPLLAACARVLSPGGTLLFSMPNMAALGATLWRRWCPENWAKHIFHTDDSVRLSCERAGLALTGVGHFGPPLVQLIPWERRGVLPRLASAVDWSVNQVERVVPVYHRGLSSLARERVFVARRA